jgi:hypothetical protein
MKYLERQLIHVVDHEVAWITEVSGDFAFCFCLDIIRDKALPMDNGEVSFVH